MDKENEKAVELTRKQMEKVTGGVRNPDVMIRQSGTDCYRCHGTLDDGSTCNWELKQVKGKLYRCKNPLCSKFGDDQYPAG